MTHCREHVKPSATLGVSFSLTRMPNVTKFGARPKKRIGRAVSCLLVIACGTDHGDARQSLDSAATPFSATDTAVVRQSASRDSVILPAAHRDDWRTFQGDGFSLRYPPDATVGPGHSHPSDIAGQRITGPRIHIPVDPNKGPSDGPAYRLDIASFPNPSHTTDEQWVDSVRSASNSHPDADSSDFVAPPDTVTFGNVRALVLEPYCGDCEAKELYLASSERRVMLSYVFDISVPGDREAQRRLYQAIVSTFRWSPRAGEH
jgi:hypothetical protein